MANILLTWELGGGLGHVLPLRHLSKQLVARGHRVSVAVRDLAAAAKAFQGVNVQLYQAPFRLEWPDYGVRPTRTFADVLHNIGFGDAAELAALSAAWLNLYRLIQPAVIGFDHSPTALFAALDCPVKRILLGTGFTCPPPTSPLPALQPTTDDREQSSCQIEHHVLENINRVRAGRRLQALSSVGAMFAAADACLLSTYPELDHFGPRQGADYVGVANESIGDLPEWPAADRPRILAYLKPTADVDHVVEALTARRLPTVLYTGRRDAASLRRWTTDWVRPSATPINLQKAAAACDLAILNATHGSTAELLLAGKPAVHLPLVLEQTLLAHRIEGLGAGICAAPGSESRFADSLDQVLNMASFTAAATRFATRYSGMENATERIATAFDATAMA